MQRTLRFLALAAALAVASAAVAQTVTSALRGLTPLDTEGPAARMAPLRNTTQKEPRNYPEQPPLIPHSTDGYNIDINSNACLSCHARGRAAESQAPMISTTHFMDRDGQTLASVSPRRFFCTGCHVPQHDVRAPVANDFVDIDTLLTRAAPGGRR